MPTDDEPGVCENCDGRLDRPGLFRCKKKHHPDPTLPQRIAAAIERDLSDRRGLRQEWEGIGPEIQVEIRDKWAEIIAGELAKGGE